MIISSGLCRSQELRVLRMLSPSSASQQRPTLWEYRHTQADLQRPCAHLLCMQGTYTASIGPQRHNAVSCTKVQISALCSQHAGSMLPASMDSGVLTCRGGRSPGAWAAPLPWRHQCPLLRPPRHPCPSALQTFASPRLPFPAPAKGAPALVHALH
jgi:hypothetical protein